MLPLNSDDKTKADYSKKNKLETLDVAIVYQNI